MSSKNEINLNVVLDRSEVVQYLETLAESLKTDKLVIEKGSQVLSLTPARQIEIEVEAKQKKEKEKLRIELSWSTGGMDAPSDFLKISSVEPPLPESVIEPPLTEDMG